MTTIATHYSTLPASMQQLLALYSMQLSNETMFFQAAKQPCQNAEVPFQNKKCTIDGVEINTKLIFVFPLNLAMNQRISTIGCEKIVRVH